MLSNSSWSLSGQLPSASVHSHVRRGFLALWTSCPSDRSILMGHSGVTQWWDAGVTGWTVFPRTECLLNIHMTSLIIVYKLARFTLMVVNCKYFGDYVFLMVLQASICHLGIDRQKQHGSVSFEWCGEKHLGLPLSATWASVQYKYNMQFAAWLSSIKVPWCFPTLITLRLILIPILQPCNASRTLSMYCLSQSVI